MTARVAVPGATLVLAGAVSAGALVAVVPATATFALVAGWLVSALGVVMVRAGRTANPAWVVVAFVYAVGPIGLGLAAVGLDVPTIAVLTLGFAPLAVIALATAEAPRRRLVRLWPLAALLVLGALSLLWTPTPAFGAEKALLFVLTGVTPAGLMLLFAWGPGSVAWKVVAGAAALYCAALLLAGAALPQYPGRVTVFDANPIWAARAACVGALVLLFGPFRLPARLLGVPLMVAAAVATGSEGPLVGLALGTWAGIAAILWSGDGSAPVRAWGRAGFLVITVGVVLVTWQGAGDALIGQLLADPNVPARSRFLDVSLGLFQGAPVAGVGIGGFSTTGLAGYPHNIVAEVGAELGLIGLVPLVAWIALALRGARRSPLVTALVVATTAFALFSGSIGSNAEFFLFTALGVSALGPVGWRRPAAG